jgi:hypothetical protein
MNNTSAVATIIQAVSAPFICPILCFGFVAVLKADQVRGKKRQKPFEAALK